MANMTMKAFLTAVITADVSADVTAFATNELAKIDTKNAKRRATPTQAQIDNDALMLALVAGVGAGEVVTASKIALDMDISTQKASALLRNAVANGLLVETEPVKGKSGKVKAFTLPTD